MKPPPRPPPLSLRARLRRWLPPALLDALRAARDRRLAGGWEYRPDGWREAGLRGWDAAGVAAAQRANWNAFAALTEGSGPLGINHTDLCPTGENPILHNLVMTFGYALALAAEGRDEVSMLDWGGGVGHYYRLGRALLPGRAIRYFCKEVPSLCAAGRELNPEAVFFDQEEEARARRYDLVLASGSLHYSHDWPATLRLLADVTGRYLLVTRLPIVREAPSFVVVQRAYACGYDTEYQGWFLNRDDFLAAASRCGLKQIRELVVDEHPEVPGAPEPCAYRGFLFRPASTRG